MFSLVMTPTAYDQPKPTDGKYAAKVFATHAEFNFDGFMVIARCYNGRMNARGEDAIVTVNEERAEVEWTPMPSPPEQWRLDESARSHIVQDVMFATLQPTTFSQRHPFRSNDAYRGTVHSSRVKFGVIDDNYHAVFDDNASPAQISGPCTVRPCNTNPMKCQVQFDEAAIFMAQRYGTKTYDGLVESAVKELRQLLKLTSRTDV